MASKSSGVAASLFVKFVGQEPKEVDFPALLGAGGRTDGRTDVGSYGSKDSAAARMATNKSKVIVVAGYGVGISRSVAELFGKKGFKVALLARTESRLREAEKELAAQDISAAPSVPSTFFFGTPQLFPKPSTLLDPENYADALSYSFNIQVAALLTAVHAVLGDITQSKGAVLVTGGGFGSDAPELSKLAVQYKVSTVGALMAAKHKVVALLNEELAASGAYAGEVQVLAAVKGTPFAEQAPHVVEPDAVAERFLRLYEERTSVFDSIA
ncbi:hypothetical protein DFJ73DRAFT_774686 [Zopfochytrium polystomum]|nr:hypothetical protein DFJ73DRAFT_774686 [Zopfochytrium polystomum]